MNRSVYFLLPVSVIAASGWSAVAFGGVVGESRFEVEPRIIGGLNATQLKFKSLGVDYSSDGYNGYALGGGIAFLPRKTYAIEIDGIYSARVFGFGATKAFFNTLQIPVTGQIRLGPLSVGAGVYGAFWRKGGQLKSSDTTTVVSLGDVGRQSAEYGYLWLVNYKTSFKIFPFRVELRYLNSSNDFAKSDNISGKVNEYQFLFTFDFGLSELERIRMKLYGRT